MAEHSVIHVPFCYFPDAVGGTEVYVRDLAREQVARGYRVAIMAPGDKHAQYLHDEIPVTRYQVAGTVDDVADLYSSAKTDTAEFLNVVARFRPAVLHVHGTGRAISPVALARAKELGAAVVLTYHTPTTTCMRGTLLRHGAHPCDGTLDAQRCTACVLSGHGMPAPIASAIALAPVAAGALLRAAGARGRVSTALRMRELVTLRHEDTRALLEVADHVVAPATWVVELLQNLGVPSDKLTLSRQGIRAAAQPRAAAAHAESLRLVYIGRLEPGKGVRLLTEALQRMPAARLELHIYGIVQGASHAAYHEQLQHDAAADQRIIMHAPIASDDVVPTIAEFDALLAPSQQFETGPLVVLEAFAAGLPVVGSRIGGIAELITDGVDGLLVEPANAGAWAAAFTRLASEPGLLPRLRGAVQPPRNIRAVADDMQRVYDQVTQVI